MWAVYESKPEIIRVLIKGGANVNQRTGSGSTALMGAQTPEVAQLLLDAGANPTLVDDDGYSAWDKAKGYGPRLAELIKRAQMKWGARREARRRESVTLLNR